MTKKVNYFRKVSTATVQLMHIEPRNEKLYLFDAIIILDLSQNGELQIPNYWNVNFVEKLLLIYFSFFLHSNYGAASVPSGP